MLVTSADGRLAAPRGSAPLRQPARSADGRHAAPALARHELDRQRHCQRGRPLHHPPQLLQREERAGGRWAGMGAVGWQAAQHIVPAACLLVRLRGFCWYLTCDTPQPCTATKPCHRLPAPPSAGPGSWKPPAAAHRGSEEGAGRSASFAGSGRSTASRADPPATASSRMRGGSVRGGSMRQRPSTTGQAGMRQHQSHAAHPACMPSAAARRPPAPPAAQVARPAPPPTRSTSAWQPDGRAGARGTPRWSAPGVLPICNSPTQCSRAGTAL